MTKLDLYQIEYRADKNGFPYHISAGGVVYKKVGNAYQYLVLGRNDDGEITFHLPKGTLHVGETLESCAVREIAEEAGVRVELQTYLGAKTAQYTLAGQYFDKTIHYYMAEYIADMAQMDNEHDFREWVDYHTALKRLELERKNEALFVERCAEHLEKQHG